MSRRRDSIIRALKRDMTGTDGIIKAATVAVDARKLNVLIEAAADGFILAIKSEKTVRRAMKQNARLERKLREALAMSPYTEPSWSADIRHPGLLPYVPAGGLAVRPVNGSGVIPGDS